MNQPQLTSSGGRANPQHAGQACARPPLVNHTAFSFSWKEGDGWKTPDNDYYRLCGREVES